MILRSRTRPTAGFSLVELVVGLTLLALALQATVAGFRLSDYAALRAKTNSRAASVFQEAMEKNLVRPFGQLGSYTNGGFLLVQADAAVPGGWRELYPYVVEVIVSGNDPTLRQVLVEVRWQGPSADYQSQRAAETAPGAQSPRLRQVLERHLVL